STETIYVRLKSALSIGTYNSELITVSGGGASDVTVTLDGNVTANNASDIILETNFTEPSNISYINYQSANIVNDGNDIEVAQFTIRDGGGTSDADNLGTTLTDISFSLTNSADIQRVAVYDGTTEIAEVAGAATVSFTGMTLTAPDGGTKTFSLRVSFNSTVTDNDQFQFTVTSAAADATGSTFAAADAGGAQSTIAGDENRIEVTATAFSFIQQPSNTGINNNMSPDPTVEAIDANSNRDLDYAAAITVSSTGTMTGDPVSGTWGSGVATFANLVHTVLGTGLTLTASYGSLSVTSNTFDITDACASDLIISEYVEGSGNEKYIEIANFTGAAVDLSDYRLRLYTNGATSPTNDVLLSGTLNDGAVIVYRNSAATLYSSAISNAAVAFNGDDAIALYKISTATNVDVFGNIGCDPGTAWTDVNTTLDRTLVRNATVTAGVGDDATSCPFPTLASEWTEYAQDDVSHLGSHTMSCTCSEPTTHASLLTFSGITATLMDLSWTNGDGLNRIVVACEGTPVSFVPTDNSTYTANSSFGSGTDLGSGNYVVYNGSGNSFTVTNLTPGTTYYFKIYEYGCQPGSEDYLTSGTPEEGFETTLPNDVTNFQADCATATTVNLSWTLPTGNYDGIMIAVLAAGTPDSPTCDGVTLTSPNTDFSAASVYCGNASGAVYVYNNIGTSVSITGLTAGTSYRFKVFTYKNSSWSVGSEIIQTAEVTNVTNLTSSCGNGESMIAWANPDASCFDEVIIAVNTSSVTGTPSGTYTANSLDYTDASNPTLSDGSVIVYNGTVSPQTVTGLTNGTTYFFKVFVRSGSNWSSGTEVSCAATTASFFDYGDLAIVGINTHYIDYDTDLSDDEIQFVCFKDITPETAIDFTDNGYERLYAGKWADSEGTIRLTRNSGASTVPAGTVITVRGHGPAANWSVFIGSGTPNGSLTNDDANWTITDGGTGNNVFDLNKNDQIWMMQGGDWINPAGAHNATYTGKVLYGWTAIGWEPAPGYNSTSGSTIFPSSACSVSNLTGVDNEDKVRYDSLITATTQRDWISRFNDEQKWTGYTDSTSYQNGGTLPDVITITGSGVSPIAKWTGETSTDWDDCTNWLNLKVPAAGTDVEFVSDDCLNDIVIQPGQTVACNNLNISGTTLTHSIKAEGNATAVLEVHGDLTIGGPAGVLDFDDGTVADDGILKIYGNWNENISGGFLPGNSTVEFNGAIAQAINTVEASADFYNMTVNNSSAGGVTMNKSVSVTGRLNLTAGVLNLNGSDLTISGPFSGTNGVFGGNSLSNLTVNGTGAITYGFSFAAPQELNTFNMNRTGETAILSTNLTVNTMQIDAGTTELSSGKYYTVNTSLVNTPGTTGLVLKSDATGTASLIQPSANIKATCERYLAGGQWNYIFSPLDNVATSLFNAGNPNFYWYNESPGDYWDATTIYGTTGWTSESAASMSIDKGYIQYHTATNTYNMTGGNLYNPSVSKVFTLGYTDSGTGSVGLNGVTADGNEFEGWNLIGNPVTS
ncbi:MAG: lamin tail domain-containing protein, partial [Bacteroidales bacterium]|nr:lamin tail domain-containing protein [Bacteroidales bacterium]